MAVNSLQREDILEVFPILGALVGGKGSVGDSQFHLVVAHAVELGRQDRMALDTGQVLALLGHFLAHMGNRFGYNKPGDGSLTQGVIAQRFDALSQIDDRQGNAFTEGLFIHQCAGIGQGDMSQAAAILKALGGKA